MNQKPTHTFPVLLLRGPPIATSERNKHFKKMQIFTQKWFTVLGYDIQRISEKNFREFSMLNMGRRKTTMKFTISQVESSFFARSDSKFENF